MSDPFAAFKSHAVAQPGPKMSPLKRKGSRAISEQELDAALTRARAEGAASETQDGSDGLQRVREIGGPSGPEPTRYGDWEVGGIASDF
jgi:hypothetical protein